MRVQHRIHNVSVINVCGAIYSLKSKVHPLTNKELARKAHCSVRVVQRCLDNDPGLYTLLRNVQDDHHQVYIYA